MDLDHLIKDWPNGRVGMVAIVGRPNVGKSTFLNEALDYRLTAVSTKPQTTRRHWRGILSDDDTQIVFIDTPGIHEGAYRIGSAMMNSVRNALKDADLVLLIIDPTREPGEEDRLAAECAAEASAKVILAVNKTDASTTEQRAESVAFFSAICPSLTVVEMSALKGTGVNELVQQIRDLLPEGPFFYPPDQLTDSIEREIGSELIREAAFNHLREEVPHALAVEIEDWKDLPKKTKIRATLHVDHASQVPIILGKNGDQLKSITREAIKGLVEQLDRRIDLKLHVKASPNWRNNPRFLKELGLE